MNVILTHGNNMSPTWSSLSWLCISQPTKELQNFFKFKDYVIVTRVFVEHSKKKGSDDGKQAKVGIIQVL